MTAEHIALRPAFSAPAVALVLPAHTQAFRPCIVIPTYDNPRTVETVVRQARSYLLDIIVVDDGSDAAGRAACEAIADQRLAHVVHRNVNGGKGAAVKTGLAVARDLGFTHAAQVDADGQHDLTQLPRLLDAGRADPDALILGYPEYDDSANRVRLVARRFTQFWIDLEVGRGVIRDAMVGFRLYPIPSTLAAKAAGDRMDFDVEIPVRMSWAGVPIINLPVPVRYLTKAEGGVSHFQPLRDNLRFSWLHTRLCTKVFFRWLGRRIWPPKAP